MKQKMLHLIGRMILRRKCRRFRGPARFQGWYGRTYLQMHKYCCILLQSADLFHRLGNTTCSLNHLNTWDYSLAQNFPGCSFSDQSLPWQLGVILPLNSAAVRQLMVRNHSLWQSVWSAPMSLGFFHCESNLQMEGPQNPISHWSYSRRC